MYKNLLTRCSSSPCVNIVRSKAKGVTILNPGADYLPRNGVPSSNKPIKVNLESGKQYSWCSCGLTKTEPFCDGSHRCEGITTLRPIKFQVEKSGDYFLCNCKQTATRPICDRAHGRLVVPPRDVNATRFVVFGDNSPVYEGVARNLGYKPKSGGFQ
ncbi:unnamed protein product [Cylicocyclus nassatus]|uniref:Iron-binding zinc finger CDGSH type domain-containing protein n=1 Tax=Cylicocyclus nassatus TaxID=53992 RepID=A0AA36M591_CYLNA|nr:unnamed protein product [Cylicocyclus nassatus]